MAAGSCPGGVLFVSASAPAFIAHHLHFAASAARRWPARVAMPIADATEGARLEQVGLTLHPVALSRASGNPLRIAAEVAGLRTLLRRLRPRAVVAMGLKSVLVSALAGASSGRDDFGFVGVITGLGYLFSGETAKQTILRRLVVTGLRTALPRLRHSFVFSNTDDRDDFLSLGLGATETARVIPVPGVNVKEYVPADEPAGGFRVALPARMLWAKGVGEFVQAAKLVQQAGVDGEFLLAGGVDPASPLAVPEAVLRGWHNEGVVQWLGSVADMPGLLASCHLVCLPSWYREGFPRVLAEAMACGRAIVTTDTPGCRDAVTVHGGAVLVPPRDAVGLAEAILRLHGDPKLRRRLGKRGREAACRRLSEADITRAMLAVLAQAMQ